MPLHTHSVLRDRPSAVGDQLHRFGRVCTVPSSPLRDFAFFEGQCLFQGMITSNAEDRLYNSSDPRRSGDTWTAAVPQTRRARGEACSVAFPFWL